MKKLVPKKEIKNPFVRFLVLFWVTGFGSGYFPKAPGTAGSLVGIPLGIFLLNYSIYFSVGLILFATLFFSWLAQIAGNHWGERDSGKIVIDEVLGQALSLLGLWVLKIKSEAPVWEQIQSQPSEWILFTAIGFGLFRLFDITKPFPARVFDRHNSGFGVMGDDIIAGLYAAIVLRFLIVVFN